MEAPVSRAMVSAAFCGYCGSTNSVLIPNSVTRSARVGDVARARLFARLVGDHARHMQVIRVGEIGKRLVERNDLRACERRKLLSQFGVERRQPRDVALGILLIGFRVLRVGFRQPAAIFCT